jgi:TetR/AcrR family tetracycline transcriptional repressor
VKLGRDVVLDAGVGLVSRAGLGALGMRALAVELEVTPMALYRHVGDAAKLHAGVLDLILTDLPPVPPRGRWEHRCRTWGHELRLAIGPYPGLARHVLTSWVHLPRVVVMIDGLATMLEAEGPAGVDAVAASNALFTYVLARVQAEEAVGEQGLARDLAGWEQLSEDAPFMVSHRLEYEVAQVEEHFAYGLDALIAGLAATRRKDRRART